MPARPLPAPIVSGQPLTALAPMQDVTTLPFMRVVSACGAPDYFFTEYFRVHSTSRLEPHILSSITENNTGRPVFAQLIGESLPHIERTVKALLAYPIAGIDLNLGCPAPKVYRKNVGGGLLRDVPKVAAILALLRSVTPGLFTVKMRLGFEDTANFDALLDLVNSHDVDLLSIHGRTVRQMYRGEVDYDLIQHAVKRVRCPVFANGNITSAAKAAQVLAHTGARGLMLGRAAIRNPWIFRQIRQLLAGEPLYRPVLRDVRDYVDQLYHATRSDAVAEPHHVNYLKKFLNFVGQGVDPEGHFLHEIRRAHTAGDFFAVCDRHLLEGGRAGQPFAAEPYAGVLARPNREGPLVPECGNSE